MIASSSRTMTTMTTKDKSWLHIHGIASFRLTPNEPKIVNVPSAGESYSTHCYRNLSIIFILYQLQILVSFFLLKSIYCPVLIDSSFIKVESYMNRNLYWRLSGMIIHYAHSHLCNHYPGISLLYKFFTSLKLKNKTSKWVVPPTKYTSRVFVVIQVGNVGQSNQFQCKFLFINGTLN